MSNQDGKDDLKKQVANAKVDMVGDAKERPTMNRLMDWMGISPGAQLAVMDTLHIAKQAAIGVAIAGAVIAISSSAVFAQTTAAVNQLNNPTPITAPYQQEIPDPGKIVMDVLEAIKDTREQEEEMERVQAAIDNVNQAYAETPHLITTDYGDKASANRLRDMGVMNVEELSDMTLCKDRLEEYTSRHAEELSRLESKGPRNG